MAPLLMVFNDIEVNNIPISAFCFVIQVIYMIVLLKIQPYKVAFRIHTVSLYLNQIMYFIFLAVINYLNFIG
jgi:hypothetical protein